MQDCYAIMRWDLKRMLRSRLVCVSICMPTVRMWTARLNCIFYTRFAVCCAVESLNSPFRGPVPHNAMCQDHASCFCFRARGHAALVPLRGIANHPSRACLRSVAAGDRVAGKSCRQALSNRHMAFWRPLTFYSKCNIRRPPPSAAGALSASVNVIRVPSTHHLHD